MAKTAKATAEKVSANPLGRKSTPRSSGQVPQGDSGVPAPARHTSGGQVEPQKQAQSVEFPEATGNEASGSPNKFDILLDMSVPVAVSIGQAEIPVRRLLQLGPGSILKLDKPIDEPVDLFLKDAKFAAGDVVVVDGRFAVRIKQIIGADAASDGQKA
jgi:flagellar motor switch protein FliN/FliY